jgi:hypothetical protein
MRVKTLAFSTATLAVALVLAGCGPSDSPAGPAHAPVVAPAGPASATLLGSPVAVNALQRTTALSSPITVSKTIGLLGGTISVPGAGLTVVVPPLAVSSNTQFSVTALAGSAVAYDFAPHRTFNLPLVMTQDLHNTQAQSGLVNPLSLFVGYFPDANNITSVTELLNVGVSLQNLTAVFTVTHFSGYIIATGRCDDE